MNKYFLYFNNYWSYIFSYRTSWLLWRLRQFMLGFMALSLWSAVYQNADAVFGYERAELFTYIFITTLLQNIILATALNNLPSFIYSGEISNILLKPVHMLGYFISRELADKIFNTISSIVEMCILFLIFKPELILPGIETLPFFLFSIILGMILSFFIQIIFGTMGFWSPDTWGPRFLFYILTDLTSGKLFPLDILPEAVQNFLLLTPFPYFTYTQVQLALGKSTQLTMTEIIARLCFWVVSLGLAAMILWKKGMRQYQAVGQ